MFREVGASEDRGIMSHARARVRALALVPYVRWSLEEDDVLVNVEVSLEG